MGMAMADDAASPRLSHLPVHFDCKVIGEVPMGTHVMFLGEVERIIAHPALSPASALEWYSWPALHVSPHADFR
jgi:flavin reductase (DIM6/NTAB) family NADH-FMN oxidoreductase RutF